MKKKQQLSTLLNLYSEWIKMTKTNFNSYPYGKTSLITSVTLG